MTSPAAAKALKEWLGTRAAVPGGSCDKPLAVAAKVTGESHAAPVTSAVGEIIKFINVMAAPVEDDADAAVTHLADTRAHTLSKTFVTWRCRDAVIGGILVGSDIEAAAIVVIVAHGVLQQSKPQRSPKALGPHGRVIIVLATAA